MDALVSSPIAIDKFIAACPSWDAFFGRLEALSNGEKGSIFERFVQLYLQTQPAYRMLLRDVWLQRDVPEAVRKAIRLPRVDEGADLIARTRRGAKYWTIQVKFRSDPDKPLSLRDVSTFRALSFNTCRNISLALIVSTCAKSIGKSLYMLNTQELGLDRFQGTDWSLIVRALSGEREPLPSPNKPRQDQKVAITKALDHFVRDKQRRGRMIAPCGTGKTLLSFWIAEALAAKTIVVAVPSINLIAQSVATWSREYIANGKKPNLICVCSDDEVGDLRDDKIIGEVYDLGLPTDTDPAEIAKRLRDPGDTKVVFTTYHSGDRLIAAARRAKIKFDLVVFDEAHRTVGAADKPFASLLKETGLRARRRLFMTATERRINGNLEDIISMDDNEEIYGKRFYTMTFKEAIELGIICDYKILTVAVTDGEIIDLIERNGLLNLRRGLNEAEARAVATGIALKRAYKDYDVTHAVSFHSSIKLADNFRKQQNVLNCLRPTAQNFHVSSEMSAGERKRRLLAFSAAPRALMTNARCLSEGVDIPAIDCVAFADPKQSAVDIIQAIGRAMRNAKDKEYGYVLVPLVVSEGMEFADFAETTAFKTIARIINILSVTDERIAEELREINSGSVSRGKIINFTGEIPVGMRMKLDRFADAVSLKLWENVARLTRRSFEEALVFARSLDLKSIDEWFTYCTSGKKPADIPSGAARFYADSGWISWPDWLGYAVERRPFAEARAFMRPFGLKSTADWFVFAKSRQRPADIPSNPAKAYANSGWAGMPDFLGYDGPTTDYLSLEESRVSIQKFQFKSATKFRDAWRDGTIPKNIPSNPNTMYANSGWVSWGDWLGTSNRRGNWLPFDKTRKEVRTLARRFKIKGAEGWRVFAKTKNKPSNIPTDVFRVYRKTGWISWDDFLGGNGRGKEWLSFKKARAFVRSLGLRNEDEWRKWRKSSKRPNNIPTAPEIVYRDEWSGMSDWLGTSS